MAKEMWATVRKLTSRVQGIDIPRLYGTDLPHFENDENVVLDSSATFLDSPLGFLGGSLGRLVLTNQRLTFRSFRPPGYKGSSASWPRLSVPLDEIVQVELGGWKSRLRGRLPIPLPGVGVISVLAEYERDPYKFQLKDAGQWLEAIEKLNEER